MLIDKLKQRFGADILDSHSNHGNDTIIVSRERMADIMRALHDEPGFGFEFLIDVTCVDRFGREPRFEVVYHLKSIAQGHRLRVRILVPENDAWAPSLYDLWKSADWLERECYDMFGIDFRGHPDLRRVLLYDSFKGYPLRKDYPYQERQPVVPETDPIINPLHPSR